MKDKRPKEAKPTYVVDFVGGKVGFRLRSGEGKNQSLAKAIGLNKGKIPRVIDATAGLGRDAFLLASLGVNVTLIERSPIMHQHLFEAIERAKAEGGIHAEIMDRMTLLQGNSIDLIPTLEADVIVVDPMHPPRGNTALVKQEMRVLREVVGADTDQEDLMRVALTHARSRVVLKWPIKADLMPGIQKPSHQIVGKSTRYDVFMTFRDKPEAESPT
jgi:16S rRNA (guanine1516-N2)-methyltransferase